MAATIISFNENCISLPTAGLRMKIIPALNAPILRVEMPESGDYAFHRDAEVAVEVFHPLLPGNQPARVLGRAGSFPTEISREVALPGVPSSDKIEARLVVKHPSKPIYVARTERLKPAIEEGDGTGTGTGNYGESFIALREDEDLELPWVAAAEREHPVIYLNPAFIKKSELRQPRILGLVMHAAIQVFAREMLDRPHEFTSKAWNDFKQRYVAYSMADDMEMLLADDDLSPDEKAYHVAECYFVDGPIQSKVLPYFLRKNKNED